jgi:1-acyl-sn-glycerol-3-phosphate acyltransferase
MSAGLSAGIDIRGTGRTVRPRYTISMIGGFARFTAHTFFREVIIEGRENLPDGPVLFTPNHPNGLLDPMLLFFLPNRLRFVAKAPLFKIPLFGSILRGIGSIPVIRKFEATGAVDYTPFFERCVEELAKGYSIVIFPEGRSLPQSYLAPLKTGPARIFLMAHQRKVPVSIVPVGLNYEQGTTFRSRVLIRIAPPISDSNSDPRELTADLNSVLQENVVQAESYQERELMILLEKLSNEKDADTLDRFERLKEFESGLKRLRPAAAKEIDRLRSLLSRYNRLSQKYRLPDELPEKKYSDLAIAVLGAIASIPGWLFNVIPYQICDLLIRFTRRDKSDIATYKVIFSLFLFPSFYFLEGFLIRRFFGFYPTIFFALLVLPAGYFTLFYREWHEKYFGGTLWLTSQSRAASQLARLRERIIQQFNALASRAV